MTTKTEVSTAMVEMEAEKKECAKAAKMMKVLRYGHGCWSI
jgi:hypothetical protein